MASVTRSTLLVAICLSLVVTEGASAQVSLPGNQAALRDRGILNRLGARRQARQERLNRPAPADQRGPAPGPAGGPQAANPRVSNPPVPNPQGRSGQPELAPGLERSAAGQSPAAQPPAAGRADAQAVRSARYAESNRSSAEAGVQPASAATPLPPNRLPYIGSGVTLLLPADLPGEVNYLLDDGQHMVIGSGEEQRLRAKGSYEIRFSRGIDDRGRSYGEARYTISEGVYRFAVTEKGWELYREPDLTQPLVIDPTEALGPIVPAPLEPSELSEIRRGEALEAQPKNSGEAIAPAQSESLPPPTPALRSILERD